MTVPDVSVAVSDPLATIREALERAWAPTKFGTEAFVVYDAALAACDALEAEREELWALNQSLASDHYFARAEAAEAEVVRLRTALVEIEVIRMGGAGPREPLPHPLRVEIGQITRAALAGGDSDTSSARADRRAEGGDAA